MIQMRAVNAAEIVVAQRLAEIEAQHFGTDGAVESANFDGLGLMNAASLAGGGRCKGSRHRKLFVESVRKRRLGRSQTNLPARARADNEANPILLSAGVINPML
jgi:hypothetical protein